MVRRRGERGAATREAITAAAVHIATSEQGEGRREGGPSLRRRGAASVRIHSILPSSAVISTSADPNTRKDRDGGAEEEIRYSPTRY